MGGVLWWIGLAAVVVVVFPVVAFLAVRIIRALTVIETAARDIRVSLAAVGGGVPPAMAAVEDVARRWERLAAQAQAQAQVPA